VAEQKDRPDPKLTPGGEEKDAKPANGIPIESPELASRPNDVPDGLQRFDTVGNDFEDCQEGHGKERTGNPPDRMPKEQ
jgi:hypothetical protein